MDLHTRPRVLLLQLDHLPVEIQPAQRRLTALKRKRAQMLGIFHAGLDHALHIRQRQHPFKCLRAVFRYILIKAIAARHIAG